MCVLGVGEGEEGGSKVVTVLLYNDLKVTNSNQFFSKSQQHICASLGGNPDIPSGNRMQTSLFATL